MFLCSQLRCQLESCQLSSQLESKGLGAKMLFILSSKLCCKIYAQYVLEYRSQPVPEELHQQLNSWLQILANCLDRGF